MALTPGTKLGPYAIEGSIGAGGMGEVYKASDTRLDRVVAIKVLPGHLSGSAQLRQRFEREARAVSSLNHPHICALYDIGNQDGVDYLVMEYLDGETLAARIEKGPIPPSEALRYGIEIADALDRAHRSGIIHRDLKPGNIMLTRSGTKLLDFGLAKGVVSSAPTGLTASPTMTSPLTAEGSIVGTFQYMAPEQLEGREADARSDIFAFGTVLYEMVAGKKAFEGKTQASLIASILKEEPRPLGEMQPTSPVVFDRAIRQCLAKDPDERWQSAGDLRRELEWVASAGSQAGALAPATSAAPRKRVPAWVSLAGVGVLAAAMFGAGWMLRAPAPAPSNMIRASLVLPLGSVLDSQNAALALSPDGTRVAYTASGTGGQQQVFVRPLDSLTAQPLTGTEGATYPFWSPDGATLGFFADRKLKRIPASGGTVQAICDALDGRGASWGSRGVIVFAPGPYGGLMQVSASGGSPTQATTVESDNISNRNPHFLPDGRRLLYFSGTGPGVKENGIFAVDLETNETKRIASEDSEGIYVEPGYMVFVRDGNLMAQPFDAGRLEVAGEAVPIAEKVDFNPYRWTGAYTVSGTGLLLYRSRSLGGGTRLAWFDLDGSEIGKVNDETYSVLEVAPFAISPDGGRAAVSLRGADGRLDLWTFDLARGVGTRFTFGPEPGAFPVWSPDGKDLAYADGQGTLWIRAGDGAAEAVRVYSEPGQFIAPTSWSPDGKSIAVWWQSGKTGLAVGEIEPVPETKARPLVATQANESTGRYSPDGRWFSWISDESGKPELFVAPYPGFGSKWQASSGGAQNSFWSADGRSIYSTTLDKKLMAMDLDPAGETLRIGAARPVFGGRALPGQAFTMSPDRRKILAAVPTAAAAAPELTLVTNWAAPLLRP